MTLAAGRLRHRVRLEALTELLDSNGDVIQDMNTGEVARAWVEVREMWAAIEPLSAKEFVSSQSVQSKVVARIVVRYPFDSLDAAMRIIHGSRVYNVEGVLPDKDSGLEYVTLPCSQGVSTTGQ
jgi:SPP1 family predicted phage head-tail adaptor